MVPPAAVGSRERIAAFRRRAHHLELVIPLLPAEPHRTAPAAVPSIAVLEHDDDLRLPVRPHVFHVRRMPGEARRTDAITVGPAHVDRRRGINRTMGCDRHGSAIRCRHWTMGSEAHRLHPAEGLLVALLLVMPAMFVIGRGSGRKCRCECDEHQTQHPSPGQQSIRTHRNHLHLGVVRPRVAIVARTAISGPGIARRGWRMA